MLVCVCVQQMSTVRQASGRASLTPHKRRCDSKGKGKPSVGKRKRKRREIFVVAHQRHDNFIGLFSVFINFNFIFLLYKKRAKNDAGRKKKQKHTHT